MKKKRSFRHLNYYDRDRMEALLLAGHTKVSIAIILKVDKSTVSREIAKRRRKNGYYEATTAHHKAQAKRLESKYQGMKIEKYPTLRDFIIEELKQHRSPDEIAGRMKREGVVPRVNTNAIYKWLYSIWGQPYCRYLCTRRYHPRKQKKTLEKRVMIPNRVSIHQRFLGATHHTRYRHFEGDTIVAPKKAKNTESIAILVERKTNFIVGMRIPSLSPTHMVHAVREMHAHVTMHSLTLDNGIENRYHETFGIPSFFCDPHSPWQKPHVEGNIGLIRRWCFPKGTDLASVHEEELQECITFLNHKYRKSLGYQSAYEVAYAHGILKQKTTTMVAFQGKI